MRRAFPILHLNFGCEEKHVRSCGIKSRQHCLKADKHGLNGSEHLLKAGEHGLMSEADKADGLSPGRKAPLAIQEPSAKCGWLFQFYCPSVSNFIFMPSWVAVKPNPS